MKRLFAAMIAAGGVGAIGSAAAGTRTDTITYENNTTHWVIGQTKKVSNVDSGLAESEIVYNTLAQPTAVYKFGKLQYTLTYEGDGDVSTMSDGRDATINTTVTFSGWKREIPQLISFPDGTTRSALVTDLGTIDYTVDQLKAKTCYTFDEMGRLRTITYPNETSGLVSGVYPCDVSTWSQLGRTLEQITTAEVGLAANHWRELITTGNSRKFVYYDALWRPVVTKTYDAADFSGTLSQTVTRYDSDGRPVFQSYPTRTAISDFATATLDGTRTTYDVLGRPLRTEQDAESTFTNSMVVTTNAYETGFVTRSTNARNNVTLTQYLTYDQPTTDWPTSIQHPGGAYTDIERDIFGKPEVLTRRNADSSTSVSRTYTYYPTQELCRVFEPETQNTFMGYDLAGNLEWSASGYNTTTPGCFAKTAVESRRADRVYDALNRITSLSFYDGKGDTTYTYHPDGQQNVLTVDNGDTNIVSTTYAYNRRRLLTQEKMDWNGIHWATGYGYSANGFLASQAYPGSVTVTYAPNALGQPTQAGTYATGVTYHPNGAMQGFTYGNGIVHSLEQNERMLPERSRDLNGTTAILDDSYDYDANGNVVGISDATVNNRGDRDMTYDNLDRLTGMYAPAMLGGTGYIFYGYDVLDNITSISVASRSHRYCYDTSNRLTFIRAGATVPCPTGAAVIALGYDLQGNVAFKNNTNYQFDLGNRLRSTTGGAASSYVYDALGRRVRDYTTASKYSLYTQAGQLAYTSDGRKSENANYVYLNGSLVATNTVPFGGGTATVEYQHTDALGTPVAVTNAIRSVIERSEYEPYGALLNRPDDDEIGFAGHFKDATTDLTYMEQRYYDSALGIFMSVDPVGPLDDPLAQFNSYRYANSNPFSYTDPDGRQSVPQNPSEDCKQDCPDELTKREKGELRTAKRLDQQGWSGLDSWVAAHPVPQSVVDPVIGAGSGAIAGATLGFADERYFGIDVSNADQDSLGFKVGNVAGKVNGGAIPTLIGARALAALSSVNRFRFLNQNRYMRFGPGKPAGKGFVPKVPMLRIGPSPWNISNPTLKWLTHWRL